MQIERAALRAPYDGRIVARSADEGTILAPGQEVLRLIESGPVEVRVGVSPDVATRLDTTRDHPVEIEGVVRPARVAAILDEVAADTRTVTVVLSVEPGATPVRHGSLARLEVETTRPSPGFWVPITALSESRRGIWAAFVLIPVEQRDDLYRLERRELSLLHSESDRAFVRGTLSDGERIVATGSHRLVPGQKVRLASAADPLRGAVASGNRPTEAGR